MMGDPTEVELLHLLGVMNAIRNLHATSSIMNEFESSFLGLRCMVRLKDLPVKEMLGVSAVQQLVVIMSWIEGLLTEVLEYYFNRRVPACVVSFELLKSAQMSIRLPDFYLQHYDIGTSYSHCFLC